MSLLNATVFTVGVVSGAGLLTLLRPPRSSNEAISAGPKQIPDEQKEIKHSLPLATIPANTPNGVLKYGYPGPIADVLHRQAFVTAYDRRMRHPAWTAQHLTAANLLREPLPPGTPAADRQNSAFKEDPAIAPIFQSKLQDYFRSGYDRGHMVAAADAKRNQQAMDETFYLTNIAPQVGEGFNRNYWAYLEDFCRRLTAQYANCFVFTIPLYLPVKGPDGRYRVSYEVIGPKDGAPNVSVPTHFAKVILAADKGMPGERGVQTSLGAFVLPNAPIPDEAPLTNFLVPVEAVEKAAGLTLFSPGLKLASAPLCRTTSCAVIIRRFDDAHKDSKRLQNSGRKSIAAA